jgi:hypothetical protein
MKKILLALLLLSACGETGEINENNFKTCEGINCIYRKTCVDNKQFIYGYRQITIDLDFDGKPIHCGDK